MAIPKIARYSYVYSRVVDFIFEYNICKFPINPIDIIDIMPNCTLCTYNEFISAFGRNKSNYIQNCIKTEDGFAALIGGSYFIIYNDRIELGRRNFTLMHEIGHIYLGHLKDFNETSLLRGGLPSNAYKVLENEANAFARNILAPITVIDAAKLPRTTVQNVFNVTYQASNSRYSFAKTDRYGIGPFNSELLKEHFFEYLNRKFCFICKTTFISEGNYCPICGKNDISWFCKEAFPFEAKWNKYRNMKDEDYVMKYPGIEVDENNQAQICPKCQNEETFPDGKFCMICGEDITNYCEGSTDSYGNYYKKPCGKPLPGNARYCPYCGSESHFLNRNFLDRWDANKTVPFDEEIPF